MENEITANKIEADTIIADVIKARVIMLKNAQGKEIALTYELLSKLAKVK